MNEIVTAEATEISIAPNARAIQITERIKANARTAVNAVCAIGKDIRTMKIDGLYTELGYSSFEEYSEKEFELKRRQAYQYIEVYDKLGEAFVQSNAQLGITKLALLATANPEDRAEVMENEEVAGMTAKELKELLSKYKEQGEQLSLLQDENTKLEARVEELEIAPKDVEVAEKEIIKEVPDQKTVKELAAAKAELEKAEKELRTVTTEAEMYKKSAEAARIEAKKVKDNAEREAEKAAKAEIEKFQKVTDERIRKAEKEKEALEAQIAELREAVAKPPENADKNDFKKMLSSVYKEMSGLVSFIKNTEEADKKELYMKKALEIVSVCKDTIMEIEIQPHIEVTDSADYDYSEEDGDDE